ncbi:hypothetical protein OG474_45030 [Kribbella sp. NBC_01505]|uniref:hypothetical protein n=1 Tax=Kribbella sp. NBC_01505 TaxID=2903580 RepID=UPI003863A0C5
MTFRRIHLAGGVLLAGLALTLSGCSDSGSTDAAKQPTQRTTTQQTTTQQPTTQQTTSKPPADEAGDDSKGGDSKDFCGVIENGGGADLRDWNNWGADPAARTALYKRFVAMADSAPSELKQPLQVIAEAYNKIQSGEVTEDDKELLTKYATAITTLGDWLKTNCPNLKIPTAG